MTIETLTDPEAMRSRSRAACAQGRRVGFVPTMGFLHDGHASLMRRARRECSLSVASIFVNPAQFGPKEDYARYPRDLRHDMEVLERAEVDVLFSPEASAIYPGGHEAQRTWVTVEGLSDLLCGASRPGHFRGVTTVVAKLFQIVEPDVAYFGRKDAQQALIVRTMARELNMAVTIDVCPTVREDDGLAMSSRNKYLAPAQRAAAPALYRALTAASQAAASGERSPQSILARARAVLAAEPLLELEYLELVGASDLRPIEGPLTGEALLAVAGRIGTTRLIDNVILAVKE